MAPLSRSLPRGESSQWREAWQRRELPPLASGPNSAAQGFTARSKTRKGLSKEQDDGIQPCGAARGGVSHPVLLVDDSVLHGRRRVLRLDQRPLPASPFRSRGRDRLDGPAEAPADGGDSSPMRRLPHSGAPLRLSQREARELLCAADDVAAAVSQLAPQVLSRGSAGGTSRSLEALGLSGAEPVPVVMPTTESTGRMLSAGAATRPGTAGVTPRTASAFARAHGIGVAGMPRAAPGTQRPTVLGSGVAATVASEMAVPSSGQPPSVHPSPRRAMHQVGIGPATARVPDARVAARLLSAFADGEPPSAWSPWLVLCLRLLRRRLRLLAAAAAARAAALPYPAAAEALLAAADSLQRQGQKPSRAEHQESPRSAAASGTPRSVSDASALTVSSWLSSDVEDVPPREQAAAIEAGAAAVRAAASSTLSTSATADPAARALYRALLPTLDGAMVEVLEGACTALAQTRVAALCDGASQARAHPPGPRARRLRRWLPELLRRLRGASAHSPESLGLRPGLVRAVAPRLRRRLIRATPAVDAVRAVLLAGHSVVPDKVNVAVARLARRSFVTAEVVMRTLEMATCSVASGAWMSMLRAQQRRRTRADGGGRSARTGRATSRTSRSNGTARAGGAGTARSTGEASLSALVTRDEEGRVAPLLSTHPSLSGVTFADLRFPGTTFLEETHAGAALSLPELTDAWRAHIEEARAVVRGDLMVQVRRALNEYVAARLLPLLYHEALLAVQLLRDPRVRKPHAARGLHPLLAAALQRAPPTPARQSSAERPHRGDQGAEGRHGEGDERADGALLFAPAPDDPDACGQASLRMLSLKGASATRREGARRAEAGRRRAVRERREAETSFASFVNGTLRKGDCVSSHPPPELGCGPDEAAEERVRIATSAQLWLFADRGGTGAPVASAVHAGPGHAAPSLQSLEVQLRAEEEAARVRRAAKEAEEDELAPAEVRADLHWRAEVAAHAARTSSEGQEQSPEAAESAASEASDARSPPGTGTCGEAVASDEEHVTVGAGPEVLAARLSGHRFVDATHLRELLEDPRWGLTLATFVRATHMRESTAGRVRWRPREALSEGERTQRALGLALPRVPDEPLNWPVATLADAGPPGDASADEASARAELDDAYIPLALRAAHVSWVHRAHPRPEAEVCAPRGLPAGVGGAADQSLARALRQLLSAERADVEGVHRTGLATEAELLRAHNRRMAQAQAQAQAESGEGARTARDTVAALTAWSASPSPLVRRARRVQAPPFALAPSCPPPHWVVREEAPATAPSTALWSLAAVYRASRAVQPHRPLAHVAALRQELEQRWQEARERGRGDPATGLASPFDHAPAQLTRCRPLARLAHLARPARAVAGQRGGDGRAAGRERGGVVLTPAQCPPHIAGDAEQPRATAQAVARVHKLSQREPDELVLAENKAALKEMQRSRARARRMGTPAIVGVTEGVRHEMRRRLPPGSELGRQAGKQPAEDAERAAIHRLAQRLSRAREATEASVAEALRAASVAVGMHLRALAVASLDELCTFVETAKHPLYRLEVACVPVNARVGPRRRRQKRQRRVHFADEASAEPRRPAAEPSRVEAKVEGDLEGEPRVRVAAATAGILRGKVGERSEPATTTGGSRAGPPAFLRTAAAAAAAQRERKKAQAAAAAAQVTDAASSAGEDGAAGGSPRQRRRRVTGRIRRKMRLFVGRTGEGGGEGDSGAPGSPMPRLATAVASMMKQRAVGDSGDEAGAGEQESSSQGAKAEAGEDVFNEEEEEEEEQAIMSSLAAKVSSPRRGGGEGGRGKVSPQVGRRKSPSPSPSPSPPPDDGPEAEEPSPMAAEPRGQESVPAGSAAAAATSLRSGSLPRAASFRKLGAAARNVLEEVQRRGKAPAAAFFTVSPRFREVVHALCSVAEGTRDCVAGLRAVEPDCARVSVDDVLNFTADPGAWSRARYPKMSLPGNGLPVLVCVGPCSGRGAGEARTACGVRAAPGRRHEVATAVPPTACAHRRGGRDGRRAGAWSGDRGRGE